MNQLERMEEPKKLGECWHIYKKLGFQRPSFSSDGSVFPNAIILVRMHNQIADLQADLSDKTGELEKEQLQAELTKEREAKKQLHLTVRKAVETIDIEQQDGSVNSKNKRALLMLVNSLKGQAEGNEPNEGA